MKAFRYLLVALVATIFVVGCKKDTVEVPTPEDSFILDVTKDYPLVSTDPAFISSETTQTVTVIVNGKGTSIDGFKGDLYAHTGVITSKSSSTADWKYVKAGWTENTPACKLVKHENNLWTLKISGGPRAFYGVPAGEKIEKLAFVFRSATGDKELKDNGNDIFIDTVEEGLNVMIETPKNGSLLTVGTEYSVSVKAQHATSLTLYRNDEEIETTDQPAIEYTFTPSVAEDIVFRAVATDGIDSVEDSIAVSILGATQNEPRPAGVTNGVNINGNEATFVLFAPGKQSVILLGEFNNYAPSNEYMMKRDGDYFWTTVTNLEEGVEYGYQ